MTASLTAAIQKLIDAQAEETRSRDARIAELEAKANALNLGLRVVEGRRDEAITRANTFERKSAASDARIAFLEKALEEFEKGFNVVYPNSEFHLKYGHGEATARNFFGRSKPNAAQWLKEREGTDKQK